MSAVIETFVLKTPVLPVERRDLNLKDPTLLDPANANPLIMGEFLEFSSTAGATKQAIRASGSYLCWSFFAEKGRSDTQALGKAPVLYMGHYEADTLIFKATGLTHACKLMVDDVTYLTKTLSGLAIHGGGSEEVVGRVIRLPANNGSKLRFMQLMV